MKRTGVDERLQSHRRCGRMVRRHLKSLGKGRTSASHARTSCPRSSDRVELLVQLLDDLAIPVASPLAYLRDVERVGRDRERSQDVLVSLKQRFVAL